PFESPNRYIIELTKILLTAHPMGCATPSEKLKLTAESYESLPSNRVQAQATEVNQTGEVPADQIVVTGPVTLAALVRQVKLLWMYRTACGHERDVDPATMPLPRETPVPEVGK